MNLSATPVHSFTVDQLEVLVFENRPQLGQAAAQQVADKIRDLQQQQPLVSIIFASAPSQNEFLEALKQQPGIAWDRINAFHMDEYIGLDDDAPQNFGVFLEERLFNAVPIGSFYRLKGNAPEIQEEIIRYSNLLKEYPADIICMGIGENCHIAFNDPHVADFMDPHTVKVVELDLMSREQQVHDGCFETLEEVPLHALTLTVPALLQARHAFCIVPGTNKAAAIQHTVQDAISEQYPSTILRQHPDVRLYVDVDSAGLLDEEV